MRMAAKTGFLLSCCAVCGTQCRMNPSAALEAQIARYREMSGAQRLAIALELHEMACDIARAGIRRLHPKASAVEVEQQLRHRLTLARSP